MRIRLAVPFLVATTLAAGGASCRVRTGDPPDEHVWGGGKRGSPRIVMDRAKAQKGDPAEIITILDQEMRRNFAQLSDPSLEPPAYYLGYSVVDIEELYLQAESGALARDEHGSDRLLDVDVRVGDRTLDNSHSQDGDYGPGNGLGSGLSVSLDDVPLSMAQSIWLDTEEQYKAAVAKWRDVESGQQLRSEVDDRLHPDFSEEKPIVHIEPAVALDLPAIRTEWLPRLRDLSASLDSTPEILRSAITFVARSENRHIVTSEGTKVQTGATRLRILIEVQSQAEDGMFLHRSQTFEAHTPEQLPPLATLEAAIDTLRTEILALRKAPIADPYTGPAVLEGRAAGVFFHEIFGHRLEGHRQKDDLEGQTFTDKLGKRVLPWFLDVVDDPTVTALGGVPLSGHYFVDDEGIASRRAVLVERGKLKGFLLDRSPVLPFLKSNGHGRREPGNQVVARQGNLIVTSRRALTRKQLRQELILEVGRQNKPYGLWFSDIEGGYTITDRSGPQAFKVEPLMVYRVYPDGRPDELVRGVELVGTPLAAFETILATDDRPGIFNGTCGAESGWVPVSAVSPSLLLRQIEIERAAHDRNKPPLLPPPTKATVQKAKP